MSVFRVGQEHATILRGRLGADVTAGKVTLDTDVPCILLVVTAGVNVAGFWRHGGIGDDADYTAIDTVVDGDGDPGGSKDIKQRYYGGDAASHG